MKGGERDLGRPVKVAVLGAGYWGTKVSREYAKVETTSGDVELSCIADSSRNALDAIRREVDPICAPRSMRYSLSYRDVLEDPEIDAVHIALPNQLHHEVGRIALERGKHVLIEKPVALTSREAFKLVRLSEENGLVLQVGHIFRFNNAVRTMRDLIRSGRLGRIFYANLSWATYMNPLPRERDIVFDLAPHPVDVLNHLLEEWPSGVDAVGDSYVQDKENSEEVATVNLEFPGRVIAHLYLSWIDHGTKERSIKLICENGTVTCDALAQTIRLDYDKNSIQVPVSPVMSRAGSDMTLDHSPAKGTETRGPNNTIRDMELHFISQIRERGPQMSSGLVGARTVQVLEEITKAMREKSARTRQVTPEIASLGLSR